MSGWPQIRAALIAVHMLAIGLMALPSPVGGMARSSWADPTVQAELDGWYQRLSDWGLTANTREGFEDDLFAFAKGAIDAREAVLWPFDPYYRYAGTWQSWRMFVAPHLFPARLEVDVLEGTTWRTVYVGRSPEAAWLSPAFDHDRMRAATFRYAWKKYAKTYQGLVDWIARRAAHDFPDGAKVRVRFMKYRTPTPAETLAGEVAEESPIYVTERELEPLR